MLIEEGTDYILNQKSSILVLQSIFYTVSSYTVKSTPGV
jgi:hypothetical protein